MKKNKPIEYYKEKIDAILEKSGIEFISEMSNESDPSDKTIYSYSNNGGGGFICLDSKGNFAGAILNLGLINQWEKEGHKEKDIEDNCPMWISCPTPEHFARLMKPFEMRVPFAAITNG